MQYSHDRASRAEFLPRTLGDSRASSAAIQECALRFVARAMTRPPEPLPPPNVGG